MRSSSILVALIAAFASAEETNCTWSWRALGCTPSKECKLKWAPKLGSFGPCVLRSAEPAAAAPAKEEACDETAAAATPTEAEAEATPAAAEPAAEEEVSVGDAPEEAA